MAKFFKQNYQYLIFILILLVSLIIFEPTITPDTKYFIETGNLLFSSSGKDFIKIIFNTEILFKLISILNISFFFKVIGDSAKYFLVILNFILFFFIFKINCYISEKINKINNKNLLNLIIIFFTFLYLPVFLLTFKILTEVYFQLICILYLQQLYKNQYRLKYISLISLLSIFVNPMGIILIGFTFVLIISKYLKINLVYLITLSLFCVVFLIPFFLDYLFNVSPWLNIGDINNPSRFKFLEKGNIIYYFLYYNQGDFIWCQHYCSFGEIYHSLKSNSNYFDYFISGIVRIFYFIYPLRPYFSLNHNLLIFFSMFLIYSGFFLSFKFCNIKNYLPLYLIFFYIAFFVITPLSPSYRYQSAFYLMLIPNASIFYNLLIVKFYEKHFH